MEIDLKIVSDTLTPALKDLLKKSGGVSREVLRALGKSLQGQIVQSFANPAYRMETWAPKRDGSPSTLQRSTKLRQSIRLTKCTNTEAVVSTDAEYAPYHQFGTRTGLPRRPFYPFSKSGKMWDKTEKILLSVGQAQYDAELKKRSKK